MTINDWLTSLSAEFSDGRELVAYLTGAGCRVEQHVPSVQRATGQMGWQLWVRLPARLDERFDIRRPILVYCAPKDVLDWPSMNRIKEAIRASNGDIEEHIAFVATPDRNAPETIRKWNTEVHVVPLVTSADQRHRDKQLSEDLGDVLEHSLYGRDLYDELTPVRGDHFFGRASELNALARDLMEGRHCGVFGLRKIGKTSLLYKLGERLRETGGVVPVFVDLQATAAGGHAGAAAWQLGKQVLDEFSSTDLGVSQEQLVQMLALPDRPTSAEPRAMIVDLLNGLGTLLQSVDYQLVVILDEIEVLVPPQRPPLDLTTEFLRGLRAIAQQTQRLSIVVAGVNSSIAERARLGEEDNPLFSVLNSTYVGPLTKTDCRNLIAQLGVRMGLRWPANENKVLVDDVGAHPALARLAASAVARLDPTRPRVVTPADVAKVLGDFHLKFHSRFDETMDSLRRYYPYEFDLLEELAGGNTDLIKEWRSIEPDAFNHLVAYGIVDETPAIATPAFARWLAAQ
jgi:hypothetical protein